MSSALFMYCPSLLLMIFILLSFLNRSRLLSISDVEFLHPDFLMLPKKKNKSRHLWQKIENGILFWTICHFCTIIYSNSQKVDFLRNPVTQAIFFYKLDRSRPLSIYPPFHPPHSDVCIQKPEELVFVKIRHRLLIINHRLRKYIEQISVFF